MRVLLLSDTHSFLDEAILKHASEADEVWHAGDIGNPSVTDELAKVSVLRAVYGNIDGGILRKEFPEIALFDADGLRVMIKHIGGYPGRYAPGVRDQIKRARPGLFIAGHSHILKVQRDPSLGHLFMNPGAAGKHGFHKVRTLLRFEIILGQIQKLDVIELFPR